jgi:hypothetical protein
MSRAPCERARARLLCLFFMEDNLPSNLHRGSTLDSPLSWDAVDDGFSNDDFNPNHISSAFSTWKFALAICSQSTCIFRPGEGNQRRVPSGRVLARGLAKLLFEVFPDFLQIGNEVRILVPSVLIRAGSKD